MNKGLATREKAINMLDAAKKQESTLKQVSIRLSPSTLVLVDENTEITEELITNLKKKYNV